MLQLLWIIVFSVLGSVGAIVLAMIFILLGKNQQEILIPCLVAFATGTLLSAALLGMIPNAIITSGNQITTVLSTVLGGIIFFFILEKLVIWRHCHREECEVTEAATGPIILFGDAFHNFVDGIVIAAAFLVNFTIGLAVSLSVIAHEIPQEVGDLGILMDKNYSAKKAFIYNSLSGCSTIPAGIIGYFILDKISLLIPYVLAISAASFLYIALSDLTPQLHHKMGINYTLRQLILVFVGISIMVIIFSLKGII